MKNFEIERPIEDVQLEKIEPTLGMLFDIYEELFEFYKAYGKKEEFHVKMKCVVKTGCEARIKGCVNEEGKLILRTLNLQHNHGLNSDKARYFLVTVELVQV